MGSRSLKEIEQQIRELERMHGIVPPKAEKLRPYLARQGHRRTFRRRASIYIPGAWKNALSAKIERAERSDDREYIIPYEFLVERLGLKLRARRKGRG